MSPHTSLITLPSAPLSITFFFNATATTEIYTLSLHDALPILTQQLRVELLQAACEKAKIPLTLRRQPGYDHSYYLDRKSTRLNSSHMSISYAVFCLKKKKDIGESQVAPCIEHNLNMMDIAMHS